MQLIENTGHQALQSMSIAHSFNKWMYETIRPYTNGQILEIGSGIGNISGFFLKDGFDLTVSDTDDNYISCLQKMFPQLANEGKILSIDLQKEIFQQSYSGLTQKFNTVFLLNVLEHLADDAYAIQNCSALLKDGGTLIILVPAYSFLFSPMDKALCHHRRYTAKQLATKIATKTFKIEKSFYFNALGIPAWLYGKIMKYKTPPEGNMKFFDKLVPAGKILDKILFNKIGLSAIVVAKKTGQKEN